ncbi:MAG: methylmalonyl Co-A mutase-associated GTPase MeaB, partial [Candidatus Thermoplasmatota archaeon]|nr:methylmalonyl Co-A mutase-associated GTPase MeaB [Candidatus Thermoplasmatota archaeon]
MSTITDLFKSARSGDRRSLSKLLTKIESGESLVIQPESGWTLGVTGPPGVGKSTLIGRIIECWAAAGQAV